MDYALKVFCEHFLSCIASPFVGTESVDRALIAAKHSLKDSIESIEKIDKKYLPLYWSCLTSLIGTLDKQKGGEWLQKEIKTGKGKKFCMFGWAFDQVFERLDSEEEMKNSFH